MALLQNKNVCPDPVWKPVTLLFLLPAAGERAATPSAGKAHRALSRGRIPYYLPVSVNKNTPPENKTFEKRSLQSMKSGA